jgi:4-hydroxy-2-oxoheptanedioate aldolase
MSDGLEPMSVHPGGSRLESWSDALATERPLLGTFVHLPSPPLVEIVAAAGFDFVILDLEHGEFDLSALPGLQRAAEVGGLHSIVRVPSNDAAFIGKALDFGADAVLVPHIETAEDAARAVAAAKYPPAGKRGAFPFMRATRYRTGYRSGWEADQNAETSVILLVEGTRGIGNIDEIVAVPGVGAIFVGPVDLSMSLGLPGQLRHPAVEAFARQLREKAVAAGLRAAIFCNDIDAAADYASAGFKLLAFSVDAQIIARAYQADRERFSARQKPLSAQPQPGQPESDDGRSSR